MRSIPDGLAIFDVLDPGVAEEAAELTLKGEWNLGLPRDEVIAALTGSSAWVGARDPDGRLIATARAISDGVKFAYVFDVFVETQWRGKGVGDALPFMPGFVPC